MMKTLDTKTFGIEHIHRLKQLPLLTLLWVLFTVSLLRGQVPTLPSLAASCDYATAPANITLTVGSEPAGFSKLYMLVDMATGRIQQVNAASPSFTAVPQGNYYATTAYFHGTLVNAAKDSLISRVYTDSLGQTACLVYASSIVLKVCSTTCDTYTNTLSFTANASPTVGVTTIYVLINEATNRILQTSSTPTFSSVAVGNYAIAAVYHTGSMSLAVGDTLYNKTTNDSLCLGVSNTLHYNVCVCPAGIVAPTLSATTLNNSCPLLTANLNSLVTSTPPSGSVVQWHTANTNPSAANRVATPSVIGTAGTYYAYYYDASKDCYSPASAVVTVTIIICPVNDNDNDGILDSVDIDDDNDGVLDATECNYERVANGILSAGNNVNVSSVPNWTLSNGVIWATPTLIQFHSDKTTQTLSQSISQINPMGTGATVNISKIHGTDGNPVAGSDYASLSIKYAGVEYARITTVEGAGTNATVTYYNSASGNLTTVPVSGSGLAWTITLPATIPNSGLFEVLYDGLERDANTTEATDDIVIGNISIKTCQDSDGDGVFDPMDLDSDNDGCSDAFEAGATTNTTTNYQFPIIGVGTNGLANSLETVADNGTINYTSTYSKAADNLVHTCCSTPSVAGTIATTAALPLCKNNNTGTINLTGNTGNVLWWETSADGVNWVGINSTNSTLSFINAYDGQRYRVVVNSQEGYCSDATSNTLTLTANSTACTPISENISCLELTGKTYYINSPDLVNESYTWVLPVGAAFGTRSTGDTAVIINWNAAARGVPLALKLVTTKTATGCKDTITMNVTVASCGEICNDGIDNDGDSAIDCADSDCAIPTLTISNTRPTTFCQSDSTTLSVTTVAGATYAWSNSATTPSILVTTGATYGVTVSKNGCTGTASRSVTVNTAPAPPSVSSATQTACQGATYNLSATGVAGATFTWRKPDGSTATGNPLSISNIQAANGGTYWVRQTASGCISVDSTSVALTVQTCGVTIACADIPNVKIGIDTNAVAAGTTFTWVLPAGVTRINAVATPDTMIRLNFTGVATGTSYPVKLVGTRGACTDTAIYFVNLPSSCNEICNNGVDDDSDGKIDCADTDCIVQTGITIDASTPSPIFCKGDSVILRAPVFAGATYAWSSGQTTDTIHALVGGTYTVSVTANGCTKTPSQKVTVTNCETQLTCAEIPNVKFRVPYPNTADETYRWLLPTGASKLSSSALDTTINIAWDTTNIAMPAGADYTLKLEITSKASGCKDTSIIQVYVPNCGENCTNGIDDDNDGLTDCLDPECNILPRTVVVGGVDGNGNTMCLGDSMVLSVANVPLSTTYNWSTPKGQTLTTAEIWATTGGTYKVTVTNNGCSKTATFVTKAFQCTDILTCAEVADATFKVPMPITDPSVETYSWLLPSGATLISSSALDTLIHVNLTNVTRSQNHPIKLVTRKIDCTPNCFDTTTLSVFVPICGENCTNGIDDDQDGVDCDDTECQPILNNSGILSTPITQASCPNKNDGTITLTTSQGTGLQYSKDNGATWQSSNTFTGLTAGDYQIKIKNAQGCEALNNPTITIEAINCLEICNDGIDNDGDSDVDCNDSDCKPTMANRPDSLVAQSPVCGQPNSGWIVVNVENATQVSINGGLNYVAAGDTFRNLAAGQYFIFIKTADGCTKAVGTDGLPAVILSPAPCPENCSDGIDNDFDGETDCNDTDCGKPTIHTIASTNPTVCPQANNGRISVFAGGTNLQFSRDNGATWQNDSVWVNVVAGTYNLKVRNAVTGCEIAVTTPLSITAPNCTEICTDGLDNDGDGLTDCADSDCPKPVITNVLATQPTVCPAANNGQITITATGANLQYSINNGQTWQASNVFYGLTAGIYQIKVRIVGGCELVYQNNPVILSSPANCTEICNDNMDNDGDGAVDCNDTDCGRPLITDFSRMNPVCGTANSGMITLTVIGQNLKYSKDSSVWQANPKFTGLAAGSYTIWVKNDSTGCVVKSTSILLVAPNCTEICNDSQDNDNDGLTDCDDSDCIKPTNIVTTPTQPTNCALANNGQINITATNGATFSINAGANWQASGSFTNLTAGVYQIRVRAISGCVVTTPSVSLTSPAACTEICNNGIDDDGDNLADCNDPDCGRPTITAIQMDSATNCPSRNNGKITLTVNGDVGEMDFSKDNGATWQSSPVFANLTAGTYSIRIRDDNHGCSIDTSVEVLNSILPCAEICDDGIDNDGDATVDCNDSDCTKPTILAIIPTQPSNCPSGNNGGINIAAISSNPLAYSINGGTTWAASSNFSNLTAGTYQIKVRNIGGCTKDTTATLTFSATCTEICDNGIDDDGDNAIDCADSNCPKATITNVTFTNPTNCPTANNGTITVTAMGGTLEYSIDNGATWQASGNFTGLRSGGYTIKARIQGQTCEAAWSFNPIVLTSPLTCTEICNDNVDNDGDGATDCNDTDCGSPTLVSTIETNPSVCAALNNGKIEIIANGANLQYSRNNGTTWQASNLFTGLTAGAYNIKIRNAVTLCEITIPTITLSTSTTCVEICDNGIDDDGDGAADCADADCGKPTITNLVKINPTNCPTPNNGSITVSATPSVSGRSLEYSINGNVWQASNTFSNLIPNSYIVRIREIGGCTEGYAANPLTLVAPAACSENCTDGIDNDGDNAIDCNDTDCGKPTIQRVDITNATCPARNNGSITLTVAGQNLEYSKDNGATWQASPTFSNLSAGTYNLKAKNTVSGCETSVGAPVSVIAPANCNEPPVLVVLPMTIPEDSTRTICVTVYDPNPQDAPNMYSYVNTTAANGSGSVAQTGNQLCYTYTPNTGYLGRDSFQIIVCDGGNPDKCDTAWVQVNVIPVNDPPVAVRDSFSVSQTDSLDFNLTPSVKVSTNDSDEDNATNTLTYSTLQTPSAAQGILTFNADGTFKFVPNRNFAGLLKLPYQVCDPHGACDVDTLVINVLDVNDKPLAVDDYVIVQRNGFIDATVLANDTDDNGLDVASVTVLKNGSKGTATVLPTGQIKYTPNLNAFGYDTIRYRVCDLGMPALCDTADVYIEITTNFINQPPVLRRDSLTIFENAAATPITVLVNDSDPDGGLINATLAVQRPPLNGTVTANTATGQMIYTPNSSFVGLDSFKYRVCDNGLPTAACDSQWVWVNVLPVNDAPIAVNDTVSIGENQTLNGSVATNDRDIDIPANTLTFSKISDPNANSGTWTLQPNGTFQFIPTTGFIGRDSMEYRVCDNGSPSLCDTAWVFVTVNNVNDTPSVIFAPAPIVNEDDSVTVCAFIGDPDAADNHSASITKSPLHGTSSFTFNNATKELCLTYKPTANYYGRDTVCLRVCDDGTPLLCDTVAVPITILPITDTPTVVIAPIITPMDSAKTICGLISDVDSNQTFTATICAAATRGTATPSVTGSQLCVEYTPNAGFVGADSVCVRVCSIQDGLCRDVKVPITVTNCPIVVDSVVVTNATCPSQRDGQIRIYASVAGGTLEYSIWNGQQWSSSNTYTRLRAGIYKVKVRRVGGCEVYYGAVTVTAPPSCTEICNDNIDNDGDGLIDVADELDCKPKAIIAPRGQ
jgi:hypothetical protein